MPTTRDAVFNIDLLNNGARLRLEVEHDESSRRLVYTLETKSGQTTVSDAAHVQAILAMRKASRG